MTNGEANAARRGDGPRRNLLLSTCYAIAGTGFYSLCQLAVLVLLAKLASPVIQGQYLFALAVATPVVLFFGLELRGALVADAGGVFTFETYQTLCRVMMGAAAVVLAGFLVWHAQRDVAGSALLILGGVFAARVIWGLGEVGWGTFQRRERLDRLALAIGLRATALLIPFALLLPLYHWLCTSGRLPPARLADGTGLAVLLYALGVTAVLVLFDRPRVNLACVRSAASPPLRVDWHAVGRLARQTFPLGVVALVVNLCDTLPRLVVESQPDGKAELGYFGSLAYITLAGNLIIIQAATAAANRLSTYYQQDLRAFLRLGAKLVSAALGLGALLLLVVVLWGRWILAVLYTPDYAQFQTEFQIIVLANGLALLTNVFGAVTTQMRLFWLQVPAQVVTLLCTTAAALWLIPGPHPVRGAAEAALVRAGVQLVLYAVCVGIGIGLRRRILKQV